MLKYIDQEIFQLIQKETDRQEYELELIASENYASKAVLEAAGSILTNKYSEWYPGKRYYAGQEYIDQVENLAILRARELFGAEYINVQPLSGSPANLAVFLAVLQPGDTILGLSLDQWGHLSHGHPLNFSGLLYNIIPYHLDKKNYLIDMDEVEKLARKHKPKLILAGFSAYSRNIDWARFQAIAEKYGAILMADISHIAGLIAGKVLENPIPYCDIVTTTTHKTLRGPRGAIIMSRGEYEKDIARAVFPGVQWWPHENLIAAKAVAFREALHTDFCNYAREVIFNAQVFAQALIQRWWKVVFGGTDNHIILLDVFGSFGVSGKQAEIALEKVGISTNKNMIPFDTRKPMDPSGIRIGTPAVTTRKLKETQMIYIAQIMTEVMIYIRSMEGVLEDPVYIGHWRNQVRTLCENFPIYT